MAKSEMALGSARRVRSAASRVFLVGMLAGAMASSPAFGQDVVSPVAPTQVLLPVTPFKAPPLNPETVESLRRFNRDRFAMFIHWGIYAEAGGVMRGERVYGLTEWIMQKSRTPTAEYLKLANGFDPVDFDARRWVKLMKATGVRYFVITAKHHDGFAMFKSSASPNNIVDGTRFGRDPLKELAAAARAEGIGIGFYYSQYQDWTERNGGGNTWEFDPAKADFEEYFRRKVVPQVTELLTNYGPVREIWFDTPGPMPERYSRELRELVKRLQPGCLLNSRVGNGLGDYTSPNDSEVTPAGIASGSWESIFTHNYSWGYSKFDNDFKGTGTLIRLLATAASRGGNFMLNEGPDARGNFPPDAVRRLEGVGTWLGRNGESIYDTTRSPLPQMPWGVATQKGRRLYLHILYRPADGVVRVPGMTERVTAVTTLDGGRPLAFERRDGLAITLPAGRAQADDLVIAVDTATPVADRRQAGTVLSPAYGRQTLEVADAAMGQGVSLMQVKTWLSVDDDRKFYTATGLTDPTRVVEWTVQVERAGDYHVDLQYVASRAQAGREGFIEMDGQQRPFAVIQSGPLERPSFGIIAEKKPAPLNHEPVGILHFDKPGRHVIRLRPATAGGELFTLRTLYLTPVD